MSHTKPKLRRGIGYMGRVFQYATAGTPEGVQLNLRRPTVSVEKLNKHPEFKRAAKKRQRRDDMKRELSS